MKAHLSDGETVAEMGHLGCIETWATRPPGIVARFETWATRPGGFVFRWGLGPHAFNLCRPV